MKSGGKMLYQIRQRKLNRDLIVDSFFDDENLERNPDTISMIFYEYNRGQYGRRSEPYFFLEKLYEHLISNIISIYTDWRKADE